MAIRYTKEFNAEIRRVVKNYNAKIKRLNQKGVIDTPEQVYVSDLKEEFSSRAGLLRRLKDLQAFSKAGSEERVRIGNYQASRYQYEREKAMVARAKRNLTVEIREAKKDLRGPYTTLYLDNLIANRQFLNIPIAKLTIPQLRRRQKIVERNEDRERRDKIFYDNVTQALFRTAYQTGVDPDKILAVITELRKLTPHQFYLAVQENDVFKDFMDKYKLFVMLMEGGFEPYENQLVESVDNLATELPNILASFSNR